jgi:hypothetical protein
VIVKDLALLSVLGLPCPDLVSLNLDMASEWSRALNITGGQGSDSPYVASERSNCHRSIIEIGWYVDIALPFIMQLSSYC